MCLCDLISVHSIIFHADVESWILVSETSPEAWRPSRKANQEHFIVKVQGFKTAIEPTGSAVLLCLRRQCTDSICNLPPDITFYWFRDVASVHSSVGPCLLLARRSGTHWQMNCELTRVIYLRQPYKLSFSLDTSIYGALEALQLMRYINLHLT